MMGHAAREQCFGTLVQLKEEMRELITRTLKKPHTLDGRNSF
jgi:hypothetical protein